MEVIRVRRGCDGRSPPHRISALLTHNDWNHIHMSFVTQTLLTRHMKTFLESDTINIPLQFSSVIQLCPTLVTPRTAARQVSLTITNSWSSLKLVSIESLMPSNYLTLFCPLLLLFSVFPSIRVFSKESALHRGIWKSLNRAWPTVNTQPVLAFITGGGLFKPHITKHSFQA